MHLPAVRADEVLEGEIVGVDDVSAVRQRAIDLDPRELIDSPLTKGLDGADLQYLRTTMLDDLRASIAVVGILCPLVVIRLSAPQDPEGGEGGEVFQVVMGHRRKYAAIAENLDLVPCWIASDHGAALQIVAQLAENRHRLGFTVSQEAEAFYQLTLLDDWTPERIAQVYAVSVPVVKKSLRLRELPAEARAAADAGVMTLDDAAKMAEFAEEPAAMARIVKAAGDGGWGFQHAIASERAKRDFTLAKERAKATLVLDGVKVTSKPKGFGYDGAARPAKGLLDPAGSPVDPEAVKAMPGFAAYLEKVGDQVRPVVYCVDPVKFGYTPGPLYPVVPVSDAEREQREAQETAQAELLEGLQVAEPVRRAFYRHTYGSARAAKRLFPQALRDVVADARSAGFQDVDGLYAALGGVGDEAIAVAGEDKLRRCLVAQWVCSHENNVTHATHNQSWGIDEHALAWWLDLIVEDGYTLSHAEAALRQKFADNTPAPDENTHLDDAAVSLTGEPASSPELAADTGTQPQADPGEAGGELGAEPIDAPEPVAV